MNKKPAQPNDSVITAVHLLRQASRQKSIGCTEMGRKFGMDVTRVNRLLGTLAWSGMLERTKDRRYILAKGVRIPKALGE